MRHYIVCILCRAYMGVYYMHSFRMSGSVYRDRGYKKVEATKTNLYMKNARQIYTCESVLTDDVVPSSCGGREYLTLSWWEAHSIQSHSSTSLHLLASGYSTHF